MRLTSPHDVLSAVQRLATDAGCKLEETHDVHRAPHYKFPVHEHQHIFTLPDGERLVFKHHGTRLPTSLTSKRGRELVLWFRTCQREAARSYA